MEQQTILEGFSDREKGAYLGAIASIATADREASEEEVQYLADLSEAAELSEVQKTAVERAATELSGEELTQSLEILKNSELKYSLIADLIAFGKSDQNYSEEEQKNVQKMGEYLGVDQKQFSLLDEFAEKASEKQTIQQQGDAQQQGGLQNLLSLGGLQDKMKSAGINTSGLLKGLLAVAAPILISRMLNRGRGGQGGGGLGGMLGGGGLGGMLGGSGLGGGQTSGRAGGLGSIIGMLNGGRGFGGAGGLLGKIIGGRF